MEQKILTWKREGIDYIGGQIVEYINSKCVDGWVVHQILPTHQEEFCGGCLRLEAAVIILQRQTPKKEN